MSAHVDTTVSTIHFEPEKFKESIEDNVLVLKYDDPDAFVSMSPFNKKEIKQFENYRQQYLAAAVEAGVNIAKNIMSKDKNITNAEIYIPYGTTASRSINIDIAREKVYRNLDPNATEDIKNSRIVVEVKEPGISKEYIKKLQKEFYAAMNQ